MAAERKSGFRGVSWHKRTGTWRAQIRDPKRKDKDGRGVRIHLGHFDDESEAAAAYDKAARLFGFSPASLNFKSPKEAMAASVVASAKLSGKRDRTGEWAKRKAKLAVKNPRPPKPPKSQVFWSKVEKSDGSCWLWAGGRDKKGYGHFDGTKAHRWAWATTRGPIPDGMHVLHKCDVPACVNPDHLFLGTNLDNIADRNAKGRTARGERHRAAKLKADQIPLIRQMSADGMSSIDIARKLNAGYGSILAVLWGKTWRHVA